MVNLVAFTDLVPDENYKMLCRKWTDTDFSRPYSEKVVGLFIRRRLDISDWNNSVLEFQTPDGLRVIIRARDIHAFMPYIDYEKHMEEAETRMREHVNGISMKEEILMKYYNTGASNVV